MKVEDRRLLFPSENLETRIHLYQKSHTAINDSRLRLYLAASDIGVLDDPMARSSARSIPPMIFFLASTIFSPYNRGNLLAIKIFTIIFEHPQLKNFFRH